MTPSAARVVDPVLTNVALGYRNASFVGELVFPVVPVPARGGKVIKFGTEDFELATTGERAPGANTKRVQYGYTSESFSLNSFGLEATVPLELLQDAAAVPGVDLAATSVRRVSNVIALRNEKACADLATNANNYDSAHKLTSLTGTSLWSDVDDSDPIGNIETAKEAIRATIGRYPNLLILSASTFKALRQHVDIIERVKYSTAQSVSLQTLAALLDIERVAVAGAIYKDSTGAFVDMWGKTAVLCFSEVSDLADMGSPSFGYTYRLEGHPIVEEPYLDRNAKTWVFPLTDELKPVITSATAGFLISPAVA
jgi:hypothetical protein